MNHYQVHLQRWSSSPTVRISSWNKSWLYWSPKDWAIGFTTTRQKNKESATQKSQSKKGFWRSSFYVIFLVSFNFITYCLFTNFFIKSTPSWKFCFLLLMKEKLISWKMYSWSMIFMFLVHLSPLWRTSKFWKGAATSGAHAKTCLMLLVMQETYFWVDKCTGILIPMCVYIFTGPLFKSYLSGKPSNPVCQNMN